MRITNRPTALRACRRFAIGALAVLCLLLHGAAAMAQTAPAGNAHPESRELSEGAHSNPFGAPPPSVFDAAAKHRFADQLDLSPVKGLAVFHDGRIKVVETLARETVRGISGRNRYTDFIRPEGSERARAVSYDPTFTFLDLVIDPMYYEDKPLIGVGFLPLREAFLQAAFTDPNEIEWWKRQGRLSPLLLNHVADQVAGKYEFDVAYRRAMDDVRSSASWYLNSWRNLLMVAPADQATEWRHLGDLGPETSVGKAVADLCAGWRAADAPRVNASLRVLAVEIPRMNPAVYPTWKRSLERVYNAANPFEYGYWVYALSLLSLLLAFGTGRRWLVGVGVAALLCAIGLHGGGFIARCLIAERFAIQNQFESMTGLSLFAASVGTVIMFIRRQWLFGAAAAAVGFMVLIMATQAPIIPGISIEREAAILNTSVLLKYHVTTVLVSYGLISLGFVTSLFYLGAYYVGRLKGATLLGGGVSAAGAGGGVMDVSAVALGLGENEPSGPQRVLAELDAAQMIILQLAFWGLGTGILLGAWWADHSWGRWWAFDPKELWALITWLVYLVVIHVRFGLTGPKRGLTTAWLSVLGFVVMLWTYFGVNLLLPGLHAYA